MFIFMIACESAHWTS